MQLHPDLPLLIALHGGAHTHEYFAAPGSPAGSFIEIANRNGFSVLAFDRPGYGASDPIPDEQNTFACQAAILDDAISALTVDTGTNGVVLIGHSIGGMVALEIAARRPAWKLIGVSVTGMGAVTAADITVPVHRALADFDAHCLDHHLLGASVVYKQLAFADACWCRANNRIKA